MRAILVAVSLLSLALSGCAGLSSTEVVEPETVSESFSAQPEVETPEDVAKAVEKIEAVVEEATHEEEEPAKPVWTPVQVTQILTTPFTAPNDVLVDSKNTEHALLSLWATSDGLRCISEPHEETRAVPGGFLAAGEWSSCTIRAEGINLTHHQVDHLAFDAVMMTELPLEEFEWHMELGRVLRNNTGDHPEVLWTLEREQNLSPTVDVGYARATQQSAIYPYYLTVCDTALEEDGLTVVFTAKGTYSRPELVVDPEGRTIVDVELLAGPEDATVDTTDGIHVTSDTFSGSWSIKLAVTLEYVHGGNDYLLGMLPYDEDCPYALGRDVQDLPATASAAGVAAGWGAEDDTTPRIYVMGLQA